MTEIEVGSLGDFADGEGFHHEFPHALQFGFLGVHRLAEAGAEDDRDIRADLEESFRQLDAAYLRHGLVGDDEIIIVGVCLKVGQGLEPVLVRARPVAQPFQHALETQKLDLFVFHKKNPLVSKGELSHRRVS